MQDKNIITIVGAGPAGFMTAVNILENATIDNFHIYIFEKNPKPCTKLLLSGGGRCNVTTGIFDKKTLATKYTRGFNFFKTSLFAFSPKKCKKWFEDHGLSLKIEDDLRVFPVSNKAWDVLDVFLKIFGKYSKNITIFYNEKIEDVAYEWEKNSKNFFIKTKKQAFYSDFLILTTGGNAYAHTGSSGDGYHFARSLWHNITQLGPSLSSFLVAEDFIKNLSGISLTDAKIHFWNQQISGSILCTHFGISGPLSFMLASHLAWENIENYQIFLQPKSNMTLGDWDNFLKNNFAKFPKKILINILKELLPSRFAQEFVSVYFPEIQNTFVGGISAIYRQKIAKMLGEWILITLVSRRPWDEFVTAGGIQTDDIFPETLESKICKNLYYAGEILNIDGYTGGFSLQICWSTGYAAGKNIAKTLENMK